jgi:hypothetical protein
VVASEAFQQAVQLPFQKLGSMWRWSHFHSLRSGFETDEQGGPRDSMCYARFTSDLSGDRGRPAALGLFSVFRCGLFML